MTKGTTDLCSKHRFYTFLSCNEVESGVEIITRYLHTGSVLKFVKPEITLN